ncbi:unnamed protein product [Anisakis simplex]|uniref:protein-tyrosine-phosphatase n=1 Tax=Anisakis simplex TaxID=6269 RepID=A0A0M3KF09_ANISI|nr:unnamed protein product [Anisakis simplex]
MNEMFPLSGRLCGRLAEIVPERLYFCAFYDPPKSDTSTEYFYIDEDEVHYDSFYTDFGPLNLSVLYRFCTKLNQKLKQLAGTKRVVVCSGCMDEDRVNTAYLVGAFCAVKFKWLTFENFDADEYEFYERVENGDFNWIIPNKILSFCGPHNKSVVENGYPYHAPEVYFEYFRLHNISTIIRLNKRMYDAKRFLDAGFDHVDLFFVDGSTPSDSIVERFINVVDSAKGAVAVHCKVSW